MDILSIAGIILAFVAIIGGNYLEGGHIDSLIQATAFLVVGGGTLGAILLQVPMIVFMRSLKTATWVLIPPKINHSETIAKIVEWSNVARKEGLLGLEELTETEPEFFARKGLTLLVDGSEPSVIRGILDVELESREYLDTQSAKVFEGMGGYS